MATNILDTVVVRVDYVDCSQCLIELQIEPDVVLQGGQWKAGVTYNPDLHGQHPFAGFADVGGDAIASAINESGMTRATLEDGWKDADDNPVTWEVVNVDVLKRHGVVS